MHTFEKNLELGDARQDLELRSRGGYAHPGHDLVPNTLSGDGKHEDAVDIDGRPCTALDVDVREHEGGEAERVRRRRRAFRHVAFVEWQVAGVLLPVTLRLTAEESTGWRHRRWTS